MSSINIRPARIEDVEAIAAVRVTTWQHAYAGIVPDDYLANLSPERNIQGWRQNLFITPDPDDVCFVAETDAHQVIGFLIGGRDRDADMLYTAEIFAIYILPTYHHRGIGRQLCQAAVQALRQKGFNSLIIWALAENPYRHFYEKLGGTPVRQKQIEIGGKLLEETGFGWLDSSVILESHDLKE